MRRWVLRVLFGVLAFAVLAAAGGYAYLRNSLPQIAGSREVGGIAGQIRIVRDAHGIPHIFAQSAEDAHFGLGYVHAQDRLWQMEMNRRLAAGRLSEFLGARTVPFDITLRTLGVYPQAERMFANFDPATKAAFEAYARGVNAFLAQRKQAALSEPLPPEFFLFQVDPEPWRPVDSIAWGRMLAWSLSTNWQYELARMRLAERLSARQIDELMAPSAGQPWPKHADLGPLYRALSEAVDLDRLAAIMPPVDAAAGSNNWVVAGARSQTGKPLLANDPHLEMTVPAIWYFAHLSAPDLNVIGATLPGAPGVVLGRNDRIAWGVTNTAPDTQDLFIERVDPTDPKRYLTPDGSVAFIERQETIKVRGGDPVVVTVRHTRHGPVISDALNSGPADIPNSSRIDMPPGHVLALSWTGLQDDDSTPQAFLKMNQARDWPSFVGALQDYHTPQQNIVYADVDGNIGFIAPGRIPVRKPENDLSGLSPAPGWDSRYDWAGFAPFDAMPRAFNPPEGLFATANDKIVPDDFPVFLTHDWQEPYRIRRIRELLEQYPAHSLESFSAMQADVRSLKNREFLPLLLAAPTADPRAAAARARLQDWDGEAAADKIEPLIFQAWYRELTRMLYADELGPLFQRFWRPRPAFLENVLRNYDGQSRWCDNVETASSETCDVIIAGALTAALDDLERRYGADQSNWQWGEQHFSLGEHRPLSRIGRLGRPFEIRVPTPGDGYTVNVGRHDISDEDEPYASTHAASLRAIYDFADLDRSIWIHSSGQSGNPLSPAYDDYAELWRDVRYLPMTMARAAIEANAAHVLNLCPQAAPCE